MRRRFIISERITIEESLKKGMSYAEIGKLIGRHKKSVYNEIRNRSLSTRYDALKAQHQVNQRKLGRIAALQRKLSEGEALRIKEAFAMGIPISHIACEMGCGEARISRFVRGEKIEPHPYKLGVIERIQALEEQMKILIEVVGGHKENGKN